MNPMTHATRPDPSGVRRARGRGFTLIELILVMAMLLIVISVAAPSLSRFFHSRRVDAEAQRLLALTRFGQNRAVSRGLPMQLWFDEDLKQYGLRIEPSYRTPDTNEVSFTWDEGVELELGTAEFNTNNTVWRPTSVTSERRPMIRLYPDGTIDDTSPARIWLRDRRGADERSSEPRDEVCLQQSRNRLRYEIATNAISRLRR